jgi:hypothetical protein
VKVYREGGGGMQICEFSSLERVALLGYFSFLFGDAAARRR